MDKIKTQYPIVFVHGMFGWGDNEGINRKAPYWGGTTGSLTEYLSGNGVECYAASVGPMSSAWDQACELYAQLMGTRIDYGEHHSRVLGHKRFGRTYKKPLFENWSSERKVHLVGHSFGGNAIRLLVHLLEYGAPDEVNENQENISPLFVGGQKDLVCSITAICSPLNGTDAYETIQRFKLMGLTKFLTLNYTMIAARSGLQGKLVDFHLEQMGVHKTDEIKDQKPFLKAIKDLYLCKESIDYDMSEKGTQELNGFIKTVPAVYYFSYPFNTVEKNKKGKPTPKNIKFPLLLTSNLMLSNDKRANRTTVGNDGLVDVSSAMYPENEPHKPYSPDEQPDPGVWSVMPVRKGDHGTPIGLLADKGETYKFYDEMVDLLKKIEPQANN
ncbi:MAG: hypothetical protein IJZ88_02150 [Clostridia bacterium]|nr:hypothetical protein [Clostridia bacterium]